MNSNGTRKNLRPPWRKGEPSPNPSGRPKRLPISDTYALFAQAPIPESIRRAMKRKGIPIEPGATFADALSLQIWMKAMGGDPKAAKEIREAVEGKAAQRPADPRDKGPLEIHVVYDEEKKDLPPEPGLEGGAVPDQDKSTK
jgi:Family of unknown function (DUF5681)